MSLLVAIAFAGWCVGLGGWLLREPGPGCRTAGVGLWVMAMGPTFVALEQAGIAPGSAAGTVNLAALAGWPLLGLGWGVSRLEPGLGHRLRPVLFVVLLLAAMLDPTAGALVRPVAAGALGVQAVAAVMSRQPLPLALGLIGAALPAVLLLPDAPSWGLALLAVAMLPSAWGLRAMESP